MVVYRAEQIHPKTDLNWQTERNLTEPNRTDFSVRFRIFISVFVGFRFETRTDPIRVIWFGFGFDIYFSVRFSVWVFSFFSFRLGSVSVGPVRVGLVRVEFDPMLTPSCLSLFLHYLTFSVLWNFSLFNWEVTIRIFTSETLF